jgi:hypothetical protein
MATNQDTNRKSLYSIIKNEFVSVKTDKIFTYDQWFSLFFKDANTLSDQSSTGDEKGNTKYNNLYSIINFKKTLVSDDTIMEHYFQPSTENSKTWRKKLTTKQEFYKTFACDLSWAKPLNFCKGTNDVITNNDDKVGDYTTDNTLIKKISISKGPDNIDSTKESLYVNSPYFETLPKLGNYNLADYTVSKLTQSGNNSSVFTLSNQSGESLPNATITFDNTGFTFQFLTYTIKATKTTQPEPVDTTKKDDTVVKKDDTVVKKDKDDEIPVVRTKPLYFNTYKDNTPSKDCSDFPFTLGCVNSKIGDLNAKLFRGDRKNDKYVKRLQNLLNNSANFNSSNPNMEITKDLWNELMNKQVIKESVKKVLKEYINKKK